MQRPFVLLPLLMAGLVCGCATNSGFAPMGNARYKVSRQAATGFSGLGDLEAEALKEAGQCCAKVG